MLSSNGKMFVSCANYHSSNLCNIIIFVMWRSSIIGNAPACRAGDCEFESRLFRKAGYIFYKNITTANIFNNQQCLMLLN